MKLPTPWYSTFAALAHDYGCHVDKIYYYADAGMICPAALLPKVALESYDVLGPAPHLVVMLPNFRTLLWTHGPDGSSAPLAGEFVAFEVDGQRTQNVVLDAPGVHVWRHNLVVTLDQREALEELGNPGRKMTNQERRTLHILMYHCALEAYGDRIAKPYGAARDIASELLGAHGISLSEQTIADKLKDAKATFDSMKQRNQVQSLEAA